MMKGYLFVALVALALIGCSPWPPPTKPPTTVKPITPPVAKPPPTAVPELPKIQPIDWHASVKPLIAEMLTTEGITAGGVLLLGSVKNNTNGSLSVQDATAALYALLTSDKKFILVSPAQLAVAKQALGLSESDSLGSRSKAVGLARYLGAQYVLYSAVNGDVKAPHIEMQLMLVQSGEIIWSGSGAVKY